ncbi:MAG: hypothetical protein ABI477_22375 [Chryseolinea sp.]
MEKSNYDAIVVGSSISGLAGTELNEKVSEVKTLERVQNIAYITKYVNATKNTWGYPDRGKATPTLTGKYPVLNCEYPLDERRIEYHKFLRA